MEINRLLPPALYVLLFGLLLLLVPRAGLAYDVDLFIMWAKHIFEQGLGNAYLLEANQYNPLFQYVLYVYVRLTGSIEEIIHYRNYLKGIILLFDFFGALLAVRLLPNATREQRFMLSLLLLLNVAYLYNTIIWEQIDSMYTSLVFGAVLLALWERPVWSLVLFTLALNAKAQAILFAPVLLLLWLPLGRQNPIAIIQGVLAAICIQTLLLTPFIWNSWQNSLPRIIELNTDSTIGMKPLVSMNAFNLWALIFQGESMLVPDDQIVYGLSYHSWGLLLFMSASVLVLWPLLVQSSHNWMARRVWSADQYTIVMLSCALIPLISCFFNTRMHERYWHASILFLGAYGFLTRSYWPYFLASVAYFLNLESAFRYLNLYRYSVLIFQPWFVAALFAVIIILVFSILYRSAARQHSLLLFSTRFQQKTLNK